MQCPVAGIYTTPVDGKIEILQIVPSERVVSCKLEEGHDGPHDWPTKEELGI